MKIKLKGSTGLHAVLSRNTIFRGTLSCKARFAVNLAPRAQGRVHRPQGLRLKRQGGQGEFSGARRGVRELPHDQGVVERRRAGGMR